MATKESVVALMSLILGINNKDQNAVISALESLTGIELSFAQKESMKTYEDSLVSVCIEDSSMKDFINLDIFNGQSIFDNVYVSTLVEISNPNLNKDILSSYLDSTVEFNNNYKQYRFIYLLSQKSIESSDSQLIEKAINKMHGFISAQPDFIAPEYGV